MKREQDVQAEKQIPVINGHGRGSCSGSGFSTNNGNCYSDGIALRLRGYGNGDAPGYGNIFDCNDGRGISREAGFWDCSGGFPA